MQPLDWNFRADRLYVNEDLIIHFLDKAGQKQPLPQVALLVADDIDEGRIHLVFNSTTFRATNESEDGLKFHERAVQKLGRHLFDGENARLLSWKPEERELIFQTCSYFDYIKTNMSLDLPIHSAGTLREAAAPGGRLEPLETSRLANTTGINGLVFSNDGHMIYQKRGTHVIVRPRELCSGFSGTIDKIDIEDAVKAGGILSALDVPREMVEELGIHRTEIAGERRFLGITRELIRGGAPEMFYAIDIDLSKKEIMSRIPKDKEGIVHAMYFGDFASSRLTHADAAIIRSRFDDFIEALAKIGPISVPLMTNLVLWLRQACPNRVTLGKFQ